MNRCSRCLINGGKPKIRSTLKISIERSMIWTWTTKKQNNSAMTLPMWWSQLKFKISLLLLWRELFRRSHLQSECWSRRTSSTWEKARCTALKKTEMKKMLRWKSKLSKKWDLSLWRKSRHHCKTSLFQTTKTVKWIDGTQMKGSNTIQQRSKQKVYCLFHSNAHVRKIPAIPT